MVPGSPGAGEIVHIVAMPWATGLSQYSDGRKVSHEDIFRVSPSAFAPS